MKDPNISNAVPTEWEDILSGGRERPKQDEPQPRLVLPNPDRPAAVLPTMEEALTSYIAYLGSRSSRRVAKYHLKHLQASWLASVRVNELGPADIGRFLEQLPQRVAGKTRKNIFSTCRAAVGLLVEDGVLVANPIRLRRRDKHLFREDHTWRETAYLRKDELEQVVNSPQVDRCLRVIIALAAGTGLREGEIMALDVGDWDGGSRINVTKSWDWRDAVLRSPKSGITRAVAVAPWLQDVLRWQVQEGLPQVIGRPATPGDILFPARARGRRGKGCRVVGVPHRMLGSSIYRGFQRALARLGLPRRRFHDLRRTFKTLAIHFAISAEVRDWMTHPRAMDVRRLYEERLWEVMVREIAKFEVSIWDWPQEEKRQVA